MSVAAGPVGRVLEADLRAGDRGSGVCYTYSLSKGKFRFNRVINVSSSLRNINYSVIISSS